MTHLKLEEAAKEAERMAKKWDDERVRDRLADRQKQLQLLQQLRARLVGRLNEVRPAIPRLRLTKETLENVEILKATQSIIVVLAGERSRELTWGDLLPGQVVALAEAVDMTSPEDRLALGILCHRSRMVELAVRYLSSLDGTPYQEMARRIMQSTA